MCFIYCYAECRYAECRYAECRYAECRYAECRGALTLPPFKSLSLPFYGCTLCKTQPPQTLYYFFTKLSALTNWALTACLWSFATECLSNKFRSNVFSTGSHASLSLNLQIYRKVSPLIITSSLHRFKGQSNYISLAEGSSLPIMYILS